MEVRLLIEEAYRTQIAAQVGGAAQVHRAVHVAQEVNQHFEVEGLLFGRKSARPELRDDLRHGLQDVALRIRGHVVERDVYKRQVRDDASPTKRQQGSSDQQNGIEFARNVFIPADYPLSCRPPETMSFPGNKE